MLKGRRGGIHGLLGRQAAGKHTLLPCPVPHSHKAPACAFALTRDVDPRGRFSRLPVMPETHAQVALECRSTPFPRVLTGPGRAQVYLPFCAVPHSHQTLACALAVTREGDSRVVFYMMLIAYVHAHLVLKRNRRHILLLLTAFCCGYVYLLLRAVLSSHRTRMGALALPCLASWTVERITLPAHPDRH